jgi:uncharacterized protein YchJ
VTGELSPAHPCSARELKYQQLSSNYNILTSYISIITFREQQCRIVGFAVLLADGGSRSQNELHSRIVFIITLWSYTTYDNNNILRQPCLILGSIL